MRWMFAALALAASSAAALGQEQQVGPNYYVTRVADYGDWTVWKAENRERADCFATLLPEGHEALVHLDIFRGIYVPTLHVVYELSMFPDGDKNNMWWRLKASQFYNDDNGLKEEGERFYFNPTSKLEELKSLDGRRLVAFATSYEERSIRYGYKRDEGTLNFARTIEAIEATDACRAAVWRCSKSERACEKLQ